MVSGKELSREAMSAVRSPPPGSLEARGWHAAPLLDARDSNYI